MSVHFMEDAGTARFTDIEVERLREYLLKGGFLLVSDYHGTLAQEQFDEEIGRALPRGQYPIVDLAPPDHAMWRTMFPVSSLPQMASIQPGGAPAAARSNAGISTGPPQTRVGSRMPTAASWS